MTKLLSVGGKMKRRVTVDLKARRPKGTKTKYSSIPVEDRVSANMNIEYTKEEIEQAKALLEFHRLMSHEYTSWEEEFYGPGTDQKGG